MTTAITKTQKTRPSPKARPHAVLSPVRRSGCFSAEPYPPNRLGHSTPTILPCNRLFRTAEYQRSIPCRIVLKAKNLGGLGAEPPVGKLAAWTLNYAIKMAGV